MYEGDYLEVQLEWEDNAIFPKIHPTWYSLPSLSIKRLSPPIIWFEFHTSLVPLIPVHPSRLSGSHWLSLPLSGLLWPSLAHYCSLFLLKQSLIGSQGPCSGLSAAATLTHFVPVWGNHRQYLIISNNLFTMNGFTEKDTILVIFCANNLIYLWQKFQPCQTNRSVSPQKIAYLV